MLMLTTNLLFKFQFTTVSHTNKQLINMDKNNTKLFVNKTAQRNKTKTAACLFKYVRGHGDKT